MTQSNSRWVGRVVFCLALVIGPISLTQAAGNRLVLVLNKVGEIVKIDLDKGKVLGKTYIPEAYYSNKIASDPMGRYILVGGGAQLALFLDPNSLHTKGVLKPEIPRLPWEDNDQMYSERLSGFASIYGGNWTISSDGNKVYFRGGMVPQLKPAIMIDPFTYEIKKIIDEFFIYPNTLFSPDGKFMFINHRRTHDILVVDTSSNQVIKRIQAPSEYDGFRGELLHLDANGGLLLVTSFSPHGSGYCLVRVDTDSGKTTNIMNDPFEGKRGRYAISSAGRYFVYNEYVSVRAKSRPNQVESVYTGKIKIVNLQTMRRQTLSLLEQYPLKKWNFASNCYMVPGQEKMLLVIKKIVDVTNPGPTYWNPKLHHRKLLQPLHLLIVDLQTATVEKRIVIDEGGFKDLAFLPEK